MLVIAGLMVTTTAVGFALGYAVREAISQHRRALAQRRGMSRGDRSDVAGIRRRQF